MAKTLIFGHKNPDTDTICSAIAYADLKNQLGLSAEPVRLGDVNGETQYALDFFKVEAPRLVETVANEAQDVILVDHNERQQSASDIDQVRVIEVIDHHRIANFETSHPLYYRAEPVGCTATILNKIYKEKGVAVRKEIAGLMLSAIISDSLLFKSPTCTDEDVAAARELAEIAGVDADSYGLDMLKAGADLSDKTIAQLISSMPRNSKWAVPKSKSPRSTRWIRMMYCPAKQNSRMRFNRLLRTKTWTCLSSW